MRPKFTVIAATYNVAPYIEAFLASLDRQTYGPEQIEVIVVDDGSTDGSGDLAEAWCATTTARVTVVHQENAGQGAARNAGLALASGEWVTFADPDDVLADTYFAEVAAFLAAQRQQPDMLATRLLTFTEDPAKHVNRHALRNNFKDKNQLVDLVRFPDRIHLSGGSAFFRLDRVRSAGIRFDSRIRPTFEDAHFIGVYLLTSAAPLVGFIRTAEYYYRKRVDASSSVQSGWARVEKYTAVPRYGYLNLLQRAARAYGQVPVWLQNTILYDLFWYFKADLQIVSMTGALPSEVLDEFHEICAEIFAYVDVEAILGFRVIPTEHWLRQAVVAGYKSPRLRPDHVVLDTLDQGQKLVRVRYMFSGDRPEERFYSRGRAIEPAYGKVRGVRLLGRTMAHERIAWLPAEGTLRLALDGRPVPLSVRGPVDLPYSLTTEQLWKGLGLRRPKPSPWGRGRRARVKRLLLGPGRRVSRELRSFKARFERERWTADLTKRMAKSQLAVKRYGDAWLLMDRLEQAQDNAEHLYRHLKAEQPEVNAWFVLERDSADWPRLARDGFRLVAYGSWRWRVLLLNAAHMVSSQANAFVTNPLPRNLYGPQRWRFTFLGHGVTKNDISRWLNPKRIHMLVAATPGEAASFTADGGHYMFTDREVRRTGLPRHDALLARAARVSPREVDTILVMPTWRRSLTDALPASFSAEERKAVFLASEYAQAWLDVLRAPEFQTMAAGSGCSITFLPHPNMTAYVAPGDVPAHVRLLRWEDIDVQDVFTRTRMLLTDYSSVEFDLALLGRPTIHYQFDGDRFFSGAQPFRRGWFDDERDGFGPVVSTHEDLMTTLKELALTGFEAPPEIAERMRAAYVERDGRACARVVEAIRSLNQSVPVRLASGHSGAAPADQDLPDAAVLGDAQADELGIEAALSEVGPAMSEEGSPVLDAELADRLGFEKIER